MAATHGFSPARLRRLAEVLRGHVDAGKIAGAVALLCRHDDVHVETVGVQDLESGTPMRRDTIFRIASMTKPIAAAAAMILVEEGRLRLGGPLDQLLPELTNRKVLRALDAAPDDTVPAKRSITLRDLLTFRLGFGAIMAPPGTYPIQKVIAEAGFMPSPDVPDWSDDEWLARFAALPLLHQPGERWMYHTGSDILGIAVARAAGMPFADFVAERILGPLGMNDTAFSVPEPKLDRLATAYHGGAGKLAVYDPARGGRWSKPPAFASGGAGLASTADDYLAFGRMMLRFGRHDRGRILARPTVELMTTDHITPAQKALSAFFPGFWEVRGWGLGVSIVTQRDDISAVPGRFGWDGGFGTTFVADPHEDLVAILLVQRLMNGPNDYQINQDFLTMAYAAIDD